MAVRIVTDSTADMPSHMTEELGVATVIVGLIGTGFVLSPIVVTVIGMMWALIFVYRGRTEVE